MNQELQDRLFTDFPKLFPKERSPRGSILFFGFECDDGWYELIRELVEKIYPLLETYPESPEDSMHAVQVKEKFGILRFYMSCETNEISEIIQQYEVKSAYVCEFCGKPGSIRPGGWVKTLCDDHYKNGL